MVMDGASGRLVGEFRKVHRAQDQTTRKQREMSRESKRAARDAERQAEKQHNKLKQNIALLGAAGVAGAVATVSRAYEDWLANTKQITAETKKAANEIVSLAALQEGGDKATGVRSAARLGAQFGITDRGTAFDVIQAMQSLTGSRAKGEQAAKTIFRASQLGVDLDQAKEAELLGISQGAAPGQTIRRIFAAGQASGRSPGDLVQGAPGLNFFDDKKFGTAASAAISVGAPVQQLATLTQQLGTALSDTMAKEIPLFQQTGPHTSGIDPRDQESRLRLLAASGIDTPDELAEAGFKEKRQIKALSLAVKGITEIDRIAAEIDKHAKPGLLGSQRAGVEAELPTTAGANAMQRAEALFADEQAGILGGESEKTALERQAAKLTRQARGIAFKRLGLEEGEFGRDYIDEEGEVSGFALARAKSRLGGGPTGAEIDTEIRKALSDLGFDNTGKRTKLVAEDIRRAAEGGTGSQRDLDSVRKNGVLPDEPLPQSERRRADGNQYQGPYPPVPFAPNNSGVEPRPPMTSQPAFNLFDATAFPFQNTPAPLLGGIGES